MNTVEIKVSPTIQAMLDDICLLLTTFAACATMQSRIGFTSLNIAAETLFQKLLNALYNWNLHNANRNKVNTPGYDLIDPENKIIFQITEQRTIAKIRDSLDKLDKIGLNGYSYYFLSFNVIPPPNWGLHELRAPSGIIFAPTKNVWSIISIAKAIQGVTDSRRIEDIWRILNEYVRGVQNGENQDISLVTNWIRSSMGAYRRFCSFSNKEGVDDLDSMIRSEVGANWRIIELSSDIMTLKGTCLTDKELVFSADSLLGVIDDFCKISGIRTKDNVDYLHDLSKRGNKFIKEILLCLAKKAGVDHEAAITLFNQCLN